MFKIQVFPNTIMFLESDIFSGASHCGIRPGYRRLVAFVLDGRKYTEIFVGGQQVIIFRLAW